MNHKVRLDVFEGPLDLLLYLIKKDELNIFDIPITRVTEQYLEYLNLMELLDLDIAGEFLLMAATLIQIKSKMLLPPDPTEPVEELDPRSELVRRLLEYKTYKEAAEKLRGYETHQSGVFTRTGTEPETIEAVGDFDEVSLFDLITAFSKILKGLPVEAGFHHIVKDEFTVADKVHEIFHRLMKEPVILFSKLFKAAKNRYEVITTFLALLELIRLKEVAIHQGDHFGEIEISRNVRGPGHDAPEEGKE